MLKKIFNIFILSLFIGLFSSKALVWAGMFSERQRDLIKQKEMECIARYMHKGGHIPWNDVCYSWSITQDEDMLSRQDYMHEGFAYIEQRHINEVNRAQYKHLESGAAGEQIQKLTSASTEKFEERIAREAMEDDFDIFAKYEEPEPGFLSLKNPKTKFEMGLETSRIHYEEPNFMQEEGDMYGMFASLTYRPSENKHIRSWRDVFTDKNKVNMFKVNARVLWGEVNYSSNGTGQIDDIEDWMVEARGVAGYDIPFWDDSRLTPYGGFGYRYLRDESGGRVSTTGHFGYDRESHYTYMPFGFETKFALPGGWSIVLVTEYDLFLDGEQKSHLEDVLAGLDTLENDQDSGWGARGSLRIMKETEFIDFFIEPFYRYWDIEDSKVSVINFMGQPTIFAGIEPSNTSEQYGIAVGGRF